MSVYIHELGEGRGVQPPNRPRQFQPCM